MIKEKIPAPTKIQDNLEQRKKDVEDIIKMSVGNVCYTFTSNNIRSFRTNLWKQLNDRSLPNKYTIKNKENNVYRIWRIQ